MASLPSIAVVPRLQGSARLFPSYGRKYANGCFWIAWRPLSGR
jgi:hypothetical protein